MVNGRPRIIVVPKVVEHLLGDYRIWGFRDISGAIQKIFSRITQEDLTKVLGKTSSISFNLLTLGEHDPRRRNGTHHITLSGFDGLSELPQFRLVLKREDGSTRIGCQCAMIMLTAPWVRIEEAYTVYVHTIVIDGEPRAYVGITKQGWTARYRQHLNAAKNDSPYLFHEAFRRRDRNTGEYHRIMGVGLSFEEAMNFEERLVAGLPNEQSETSTLYPHGLNMIPGGFAGLRYLAKFGLKHVGPKQWENRQQLLREFAAHCEREHRPNLLMAARWRDDEYAKSVIFGNPNNFTREQVDEIRYMASLDHPAEMIAGNFRCSVRRIKMLIEGQTYSRV